MLLQKQKKDYLTFLGQFSRRQHRYPWQVIRNPDSEKQLQPFGSGGGALLNPRADIYMGEEGPGSNMPGNVYFIRKDPATKKTSIFPTSIPGYPQISIPMSDGTVRKVGVHQAAGPTLFDRAFLPSEVVDHMKSPLSNTKSTLRIVNRDMNAADSNIVGVSVSLQDGKPKWRANVSKGNQRKVGLWYNDPEFAQRQSALLYRELYGKDLVHPRRKMTKQEINWRIDRLKAKQAAVAAAAPAGGAAAPAAAAVVELADEDVAADLDEAIDPPPPPVQNYGGVEVPKWISSRFGGPR